MCTVKKIQNKVGVGSGRLSDGPADGKDALPWNSRLLSWRVPWGGIPPSSRAEHPGCTKMCYQHNMVFNLREQPAGGIQVAKTDALNSIWPLEVSPTFESFLKPFQHISAKAGALDGDRLLMLQ